MPHVELWHWFSRYFAVYESHINLRLVAITVIKWRFVLTVHKAVLC